MPTTSSPYTFHASDVECALRNDGHLVYMDAERRGVWCFYLVGKDSSDTPGFTEHSRLGPTLDVCGYHLKLVTQGAFEPASLQKGRPPGTHAMNTPSSSGSSGSARSAQSFNMPFASSIPDGAMELDTTSGHTPVTPQGATGYTSVPVKEIYGFFINSMLSSLSTAFCRSSGAMSMTRRTLLLPAKTLEPNEGEAPRCPPLAALATFRIYLTTTGSLVINLAVAAVEGLLSAADSLRSDLPSSSSASILAAPLGYFGSAQSVLDRDMLLPDYTSGQTPDTQITRYRPDISDKIAQWKVLLDLHGISPSILEGCSWLNIQFLNWKPYEYRNDGNPLVSPAPTVYAWPSVLCFRKPNRSMLLAQDAQGGLLGNGEDFDPLGSAKDWFESNTEREELFSKRRKKEQQESALREAVEMDGRNQRLNDSSPLALARISNAGVTTAGAAAGAMYPTPPDGVQPPPHITPSLDGTISSPPTQPSVVVAVDNDHSMTSDGQLAGSVPGGWDTEHTDDTDQRREQSNTAFFDGENMFGDLGEDLFTSNELTDADFNYFDQVDQEPGDGGLSMSGLQDINMDDALDLAANLSLDQAVVHTSYNSQASEERQPAAPVPPVFTKPELKHARSTLGEEGRHQQINSASYQANVAAGMKRQASPFDPDAVYKRVRASLSGPPAMNHFVAEQPARRRSSVFEKMDFDPSLSMDNKKYQESGQFRFNLPSPKDKDDGSGNEQSLATIPKTHQYSRRRAQPPRSSIQYGELIAKITNSVQMNSLNQHPTKRDDVLFDEDDSLVSDQDDSSQGTGEPSSPTKSSVARTRVADDDNLSLAGSSRDLEHGTALASPAYAIGDLSTLQPQPAEPEVSVTKYFSDPQPWPLQLSCLDEDYITIAQILTEQAVSGSLLLGSRSKTDGELQETRRSLANAARHSIQCLRSVLPSSLGGATECLLKPFIDVQDVPLLPPPGKMQPRPVGQEPRVLSNLYQIAAPHIELRRHESKLSVLPTAVAFWESLGLSPSQGTKDISAICVFPDWKGMQDNMTWFLDRIRSIYESLKMGTFERMPSLVGMSDGLAPYLIDRNATSPFAATTPRAGSALAGHMSQLAHQLATLTSIDKNLVVYFVYTPENPSSIVEACAAFQELYEMYKRVMADRKRAITNELVLQLVSLDSVASETSLAILTPADYTKLCVETYDRCTLFGGPMPAPAIVLEQALPNRIDFKATTNPPAHVLQENSCIHIAYARSVDERWITAAWTDNRGSKQMTASYCLGRRARPLSNSLTEIMREIWETTHDLISVWKVHWRVIITKCGPMDQTEVDYWLALAQNESKTSVSLSLLTVDTNPSLQLIPPPAKIPVTAPSVFYTTPVSTPGPTANVSPEQSGNASTPMGGGGSMNTATPGVDNSATEPEADTTLVDVTDMTWGAVMSHRLNNSASLTELNPAMISGYLIKRSSIRPEDPPVTMEVNVIHSENPRAFEQLLREMLVYFRGLGTLARLRGMVDRETDVRPWHVAAAEKGVRTLYQLM